jgi:hypothetical protein
VVLVLPRAKQETRPLFFIDARIMKIRDDIPDFSWAEVLAGFQPDERFYRHMELLQELRDWWKAPIKITSGFRSPKHNEAIGGAPKSQHQVFATDIQPNLHGFRLAQTPPFDRRAEMIILVAAEAERLGFTGIGKYDMFVHLDLRDGNARWDERTV